MKRIIIVFLLVVVSFPLFAQFEVSGVIRPRFEYRNGYKTLRDSNTTMAAFVSQRTRLSFKYTNDKLKTGITLYDFRVWGDQQLKSDQASMGLYEAWAEISLSKPFSLKLGRQSFKYDNSRLISPVNWNQIGAAHDAALLKYRKTGWKIDFAMAYNQTAQNNFGTDYSALINNYKSLNFLWINKEFGRFNLASLSILDSYQKQGSTNVNYLRFTSGGIVKYKQNFWELDGRAFYQMGRNKNGQKMDAYYLNGDINLRLKDKIKLIAGAEVMSGNDAVDSLNTVDNAFDIVVGGRHKFNGRMDYFSVPSSTANAGLINPYLRCNFQWNKKVSLLLEYHYFMLYGNCISENKIMEKDLGHEVDLTYKQKFTEDLTLEAGYAMIFASETTKIIKSGDNTLYNNWAYLMLTISPQFFKSKQY